MFAIATRQGEELHSLWAQSKFCLSQNLGRWSLEQLRYVACDFALGVNLAQLAFSVSVPQILVVSGQLGQPYAPKVQTKTMIAYWYCDDLDCA